MNLLHTSDLRLGASFPRFPERADALRQARVDALSSLVALAQREAVDALVITGNTLVDNRVGHRTVLDLSRLLASSRVPVLLLAGRTDPLTPDSPYRLRSELFASPVQVLRPGQVVDVGPLRFFACNGELGWIPARDGSGQKRVGMAVGEWTLPQLEELAQRHDLDYLAAGGRPGRTGAQRAGYSGTPEPDDFGQDSGSATVVDLAGEHRTIRVGSHLWESLSVSTADLTRLDEYQPGANVLLRLELTGQLDVAELEELERKLDKLRLRCLELEVVDRIGLREGSGSRNPLLRQVQLQLSAAARTVRVEPEEVPEDHEVARAASLRLHRLLARSGREDLQ